MRNNSKEIQVLTLKPESLFVIIKPAALTKEVIYRNNEKIQVKRIVFVYGIMKLTQMVPKIDAAKSELSLL